MGQHWSRCRHFLNCFKDKISQCELQMLDASLSEVKNGSLSLFFSDSLK